MKYLFVHVLAAVILTGGQTAHAEDAQNHEAKIQFDQGVGL